MAEIDQEAVDQGEDSNETETKPTTEEKKTETPQQKKARLERQLKKVRKELGEEDEPDAPSKDKKESTDLDWGQKAFLKASGISGSDELALVREFMRRTGDSLDSIVEDDIFKARLDRLRATKANELAASTGPNRGSPTGGRNTVEYWLAKGEHPPKELGAKLAQEYVQARRNQGANAKVFYSD